MGLLGGSGTRRTLGGVLGQRDRMGMYQLTDMATRAESAQTAVSNTAGMATKKGSETKTKMSDAGKATIAMNLGATGAKIYQTLGDTAEKAKTTSDITGNAVDGKEAMNASMFGEGSTAAPTSVAAGTDFGTGIEGGMGLSEVQSITDTGSAAAEGVEGAAVAVESVETIGAAVDTAEAAATALEATTTATDSLSALTMFA
jgi:hypothetical protein